MSSWSPPGGAEPATRRAPFSANPEVGERGRRTQQRIFEAAMRCFDELGYERSTVDKITRAAGCSRATFYQYFSGRDELFRQVAGQATAELTESERSLGPVTPDQTGWNEIHEWVNRHDVVYDRYEPLFRAYDVAVELDEKVAGGTAILSARYAKEFRTKVSGSTLPDRSTLPVITLLNKLVTRARRLGGLMTATTTPALDSERVAIAITDVIHRTLFGTSPINGRTSIRPECARREPLSSTFRDRIEKKDGPTDLNAAARRTLATLLEASQTTLLANGYHRTRVSGITAAAGQSHGIFYHYFSGKDEVTEVLAMRALRQLVDAYLKIPNLGDASSFDPAELRRWLGHYGRSHAREAGMVRVWIDSTAHDGALLAEAAAGLEWARQWMADVLAPRGFGDAAADGLLLVTLLEVLGAREPTRQDVEAVALCIERAFVGRPFVASA